MFGSVPPGTVAPYGFRETEDDLLPHAREDLSTAPADPGIRFLLKIIYKRPSTIPELAKMMKTSPKEILIIIDNARKAGYEINAVPNPGAMTTFRVTY